MGGAAGGAVVEAQSVTLSPAEELLHDKLADEEVDENLKVPAPQFEAFECRDCRRSRSACAWQLLQRWHGGALEARSSCVRGTADGYVPLKRCCAVLCCPLVGRTLCRSTRTSRTLTGRWTLTRPRPTTEAAGSGSLYCMPASCAGV